MFVLWTNNVTFGNKKTFHHFALGKTSLRVALQKACEPKLTG